MYGCRGKKERAFLLNVNELTLLFFFFVKEPTFFCFFVFVKGTNVFFVFNVSVSFLLRYLPLPLASRLAPLISHPPKSSAVNMVFWKPPPTSENTCLAKSPALDKCKSDDEWRKELPPNTFQVFMMSPALTTDFCASGVFRVI